MTRPAGQDPPSPRISIQLATRNPRAGTLRLVLEALARQTLPAAEQELVLVDNGSTNGVVEAQDYSPFPHFTLIREPMPGVVRARWTGFQKASTPILILVDDDTVLRPDYLEIALQKMAEYPGVGMLGGAVHPVFEGTPPDWVHPFHHVLALRAEPTEDLVCGEYQRGDLLPHFAPPGAGMVLRREALEPWLEATRNRMESGTSYNPPSSSEDNDIMLCARRAGWRVAQVRGLHLDHLLDPARLTRERMAEMLERYAMDWLLMCREHGLFPRTPVPRAAVPFMKARMWWRMRAWRSDRAYLSWRAYCGEATGRGMLGK